MAFLARTLAPAALPSDVSRLVSSSTWRRSTSSCSPVAALRLEHRDDEQAALLVVELDRIIDGERSGRISRTALSDKHRYPLSARMKAVIPLFRVVGAADEDRRVP